MSASLKRRALVGALAAMPLRAAAAQPLPDATLLALGSRFNELLLRFDVACSDQQRLHPVWEKACLSHGPLTWGDNAARDRFAVETGYNEVCRHMNHLCSRLVRLGARIRDHEPQTLDGLAVWARAALFEANDYEPRDKAAEAADAADCQIHHLVAQIERMAGAA